MTVSSTDRTAGPYIGSGVEVSFPFGFRVFAAADLVVVETDTDGVTTTLVRGTDYTVSVNADQRTTPGGTVTKLTPLALGHELVFTTNLQALQGLRLTTAGGFYPEAIENSLDLLTMLIQQLELVSSRSLRFPYPATVADASFTPDQLTSAVNAAYAASALADAVSFTPAGVGAVSRTVQAKLRDIVHVKDFGAVLDGVTDDTLALQRVLDANKIGLIDGPARITSSLLIDPVRNRGCGFICLTSVASRYPTTTQAGGPAWTGQGEARIIYDGSTSSTAAVIAASAEAVGVEPAATFANSIWGLILENITLDANNKAGFGLYTARVQGLRTTNLKARGGTVAGISINGTYSGNMRGTHCYLNPGRGFELGAADSRWGWSLQDKVNAFYINDLHCDANGSSATFRQSDPVLAKENCGVFFGPHRGVALDGVVSENNFGANIIFEPTSSGNVIRSAYTELGCKYAPSGAGSDAISLGYATDQLGVVFVGSTAAYHNRIEDYACAIDKIWLTGTEPSAPREEGGVELNNVVLTSGLIADWANYRLVNCAIEAETISGTQPAGAFTLRGGLQLGAGTDNLTVYDEGTWTPGLAGASTPGTGWAYTVAAGDYTRIGRHVFFTGRIALSAASGTAVGGIVITGLPFAVRNANNASSAVTIAGVSNLTTAVVSIGAVVDIGGTTISLNRRTAAATSASSLVLADLSSTTTFTFSGHYTV